ncbi:MAG: glycosyltransferase family 39 protein [Candidatus Nitrosocosmicus sp.]|nr:glycosyltransferase family 39 protein [Candidatus Nitrosocosmicus sp.]
MLSSICIVVFYFFVKKNFGLKIASFSAPLLAMMPGFIWYSVRIRPDVLAFTFTILSIYYASKKITYKNAVYCGIFVSLAHLSHPIGLIPGSAILIYFVIKKKFREASLLVIVWCLISIPWLVRNYLVLGDATQGFGLPIPRSISLLLGLISPDSTITNAGDVGSLFGISIVKILDGMLNEFVNLYGTLE